MSELRRLRVGDSRGEPAAVFGISSDTTDQPSELVALQASANSRVPVLDRGPEVPY